MIVWDAPSLLAAAPLKAAKLYTFPKYLNSPETPIFHKGRHPLWFCLGQGSSTTTPASTHYGRVYRCDCLPPPGVTHAVGTLGTALTEHHVRLLKGLVKEVVLVFDSDAAGGAATERSIALFLDAGMRVRVVTLPRAKIRIVSCGSIQGRSSCGMWTRQSVLLIIC